MIRHVLVVVLCGALAVPCDASDCPDGCDDGIPCTIDSCPFNECANYWFDDSGEYGVGLEPTVLLVADLDQSGTPDVITGGYPASYPALVILRGVGDGTLVLSQTLEYRAGGAPLALGAGDLDGDGDLDIVSAESWAICVFQGNGVSGFQMTSELFTAHSLEDLVVADFTNDGNMDVAATGSTFGGGLTILVGDGEGTLTPLTPIALSNDGVDVTAADMDDDGNLDLVITGYSGSVGVLLGFGDGTFAPGLWASTGSLQRQTDIADFNNDGILDMAVALGDGVSVFLGNGDGTFQSELELTGTGLYNLVAFDLNADGNMDIVGYNIYFGNGDGTFDYVRSLAMNGEFGLGDFDFDGAIDGIELRENADAVGLLRGLCAPDCAPDCPMTFVPGAGNPLVGNVFGSVMYGGQTVDLVSGFPNPLPYMDTATASLESGGTIVDGETEVTTLIARFDAMIIGNEMFLELEESGYLDANATGFGEVAVSVGSPFVFRVPHDSHFVASSTFTFDAYGDGASINGSFLTAGDYTLTANSPFAELPAPGESYSEVTTAYFALLDSCPGDIADPIGEVDVADLLALLANWNSDGPGANLGAPFDVVEVSDLLTVLANWGACGL